MRTSWFGSMRVRILAVVIGLLLVSAVGSVLVLRAALLANLEDEVAVSLEREAEEFRLLAGGTDPRTGEPFAGDLEAVFDVYFAREVPDEGESLLAFVDGALYESRRATGAAEPGELTEATASWLALDADRRGVLDTPVGEARYVALPLEGADGRDGVFVVANFPALERDEIEESVRAQLQITLVALVLASIVGALLAGRVLRPLVRLAHTARTISDTDLTRRIPVRGRDEASMIALAFNDMLTRLEQVFATQRAFLDDTSHELRTPLTIIRGQIELLALDDTEEARAETIALVTDEVDRLSRMVDDLFLLARAEHPDFLRPDDLAVDDLVEGLHRTLAALAPVHLRVEALTGLVVRADRQRLTQAVVQLVSNALRHAGPDATIEVVARADGSELVLTVGDDGPGVPAAEAESIFDRSVRGGSAAAGGAGLGLSIVRAILEAHRGSARVLPTDGPGATFELRLPLGSDVVAGV
ncbi:sensor histidine kinase [Nocardioides aquaticus]|nr:ATP-binding protein [Nocardioides aquaticus]